MACDKVYEYQWTEDGQIEYGKIHKQKAVSESECYHCGYKIMKNQDVTFFCCNDGDVYEICQKCSQALFK